MPPLPPRPRRVDTNAQQPHPPVPHALHEAVLKSRTRWRDMVQFAADLVFETDADGRFCYLWPQTFLGWPASALLGAKAANLLAEPGHDADPFAPGARLRSTTIRLCGSDGQVTAMSFSCGPAEIDGKHAASSPWTIARRPAVAGVRGFAAALPGRPEASPDAATPLLHRLPGILWRMRAQLLPSAMVQTALHALLEMTGAEGAALLQTPLPADNDLGQSRLFSDFPMSLDAPRIALRSSVGHLPREFGETLELRLAALAAEQTGLSSHLPWLQHLSLPGRHVLVCGAPNGIGTLGALAVWRADSAPWPADIGALASCIAAVSCAALEQDQIAREVSRQTRGDALTGLLSREAFQDEVERRFERLDRAGLPGVLALADLTRFRHVNDRFGPERGDGLLRQTALMLRDAVRATDIVGREGGDVFALWLDGADRFAAAERAEHLCRSGQRLDLAASADATVGLPVLPEMSIGMALRAPRGFETFESLAQRSHAALLDAKRARRDGRHAWVMSTDEPVT